MTTCAIVGYGAIAEFHAEALRASGARLVAAVGPNHAELSEFARRHRITHLHRQLTDLLATDDVDAVIIASPSKDHAAHAAAALRAGKHVLCEIPVSLSLSDAEMLVGQARESGVVAMACHTQRFWRTTNMLLEVIGRESLQVHHVASSVMMRRLENVGWTGRKRSWTDNVLWHHGGHAIDTSRLIIGDEISSLKAASGARSPTTGLPMDYGIVMTSSAGAVGTLALSYNALVARNDYLVITDRATYDMRLDRLTRHDGFVLFDGDPDEEFRLAVLHQDREFLSSVRSGQSNAASIESVLPTMRLLQQAADEGAASEQRIP